LNRNPLYCSATPALQAESGLSAAEKAEEERLMRAMQRKAGPFVNLLHSRV